MFLALRSWRVPAPPIGLALALALASAQPLAAQAVADCDSLRAVAQQATTSWFTTTPAVDHMVLPPSKWPKDFLSANVLVSLVVDPLGRPVPDSILVTGTTDSGYVRKLHKTFAQFRFRPATKGACTVPGRYQQTIQFQH
jgi:hypothetical protein